jgi:peroxiredoxin
MLPATTQLKEGTMLKTGTHPRVGDAAPDITLTRLDGQTARLTDYRGKKLLVFMWASW